MSAIDILFPVGVIAAVGVWLKRQFGGTTTTTTPAPSVPSSTPVGGAQSSTLPTNSYLTKEQVHSLAQRLISVYGFLVSAQELTVTADIESSFRPWVYRNETRANGTVWDTSWGLMQTLLGTAQDMYNKGYKAMGMPTSDALKKPEVSMYFGAAYKDWLRRSYPGKSPEWYVRAYNGGPGWEKTQNGPANTAVYYTRYLNARRKLYGV